MSEILKKIEANLKAFEKKKKEFVKELRKEFPGLFVELFQESELIKSIGWTAYTDYFNDGEECEFHVHIDYLTINEEDSCEETEFLQEEIWNSEKQAYVPNENFNKKEHQILEKFKKILSKIPKEFMKDLFGDHVEVTINNKGKIKVTEYTHHD